MAFQPIINIATQSVFAYEALVRGQAGESAGAVLSRVTDQNRYFFDRACRVTAIEMASRLQMATRVSINLMPNAVYRPERCIRPTLAAAATYGWPLDRIIFEVVESEEVQNVSHLASLFDDYRERGLTVALDDFGAGYSNLDLLERLHPDLVKLDISLVSGIAESPRKQAVACAVADVCQALGITPIVEGEERADDLAVFRRLGADLYHRYLFARPA